MADIINFQRYINAKDVEKECVKQVLDLSEKIRNTEQILCNIRNSIGCLFVTNHLNEIGQVVRKENAINPDILGIIVNSLNDYDNKIHEQINELNNCRKLDGVVAYKI